MRDMFDHCWGTSVHKAHVARFLISFSGRLLWRAVTHDLSKFGSFERSIFAKVTPQFKGNAYGSDGYKACLDALGPALKQHYESNRHHPEHFGESGIWEMNLVDLVEMVCDWKAASKRHPGSNLMKSIDINEGRWPSDDQLIEILRNTAHDFGW